MGLLDRKAVRWGIHLVFAALGLGAVAWLLHRAGTGEVLGALRATGPWLPAVFALEGARIVADAWRTRLLYRRGGRDVPFRRVLPVQVASYPLALLVPAGGAASEAFKATALAAEAGAPLAAASATANQALALFSVTIISMPCVAAAWSTWGWASFTIPIAIQASTAIGLALPIQLATREKRLGRAVAKISARAGVAAEAYQIEVRKLGVVPLAPLGAAVIGRTTQLAQLGILAHAAGAPFGLRSALLALGVQLVGGAAGDMIPAQVGATDGSFTLAAPSLGIDPARALAIPLAMHAAQLAWALVGALAPLRTARSPTP